MSAADTDAVTRCTAALTPAIGGRLADWSVRLSPRRKHYGATVCEGGRVEFVGPADADPERMLRFWRAKCGQIINDAADRAAHGVHIKTAEFVNGAGLSWLGINHRVRLVDTMPEDAGQRICCPGHVEIGQTGRIVAEAGPSTWSGHRTGQLTICRDAATAADLAGWYRQQGQAWLDRTVPAMADRFGIDTAGLTWSVRPFKPGERPGSGSWARWRRNRDGSRHIAVHWVLFQMPTDHVRHALTHELCHDKAPEADHGRMWQAQMMLRCGTGWRDMEERVTTARGLTLWAGAGVTE